MGFTAQMEGEGSTQHKTAGRLLGELLGLGTSRKGTGKSRSVLAPIWSPYIPLNIWFLKFLVTFEGI